MTDKRQQDVLVRARAWLQAADARGINYLADENGYLAVIHDLVAEIERLNARFVRHRSGCVCNLSEDGETILEWCLAHASVIRRAEAANARIKELEAELRELDKAEEGE